MKSFLIELRTESEHPEINKPLEKKGIKKNSTVSISSKASLPRSIFFDKAIGAELWLLVPLRIDKHKNTCRFWLSPFPPKHTTSFYPQQHYQNTDFIGPGHERRFAKISSSQYLGFELYHLVYVKLDVTNGLGSDEQAGHRQVAV